jgi:hypothetical protein
MKHLSCIGTALLLVTAMTTAARADDPPAAGEPMAPTEAPAPAHAAAAAAMAGHKFTGDKTSYYIAGNVSDSPFFNVGLTLASGWSFAIGGSLEYNGNGLPGPTGAPSSDKIAFDGLLYGAYYFYNKFPVGIAGEVAAISPINPNTLKQFTIQPGLVMYYAPFPVPLVIGTALDVQVTFFRDIPGAKSIVNTLTPGVRLIYVIP